MTNNGHFYYHLAKTFPDAPETLWPQLTPSPNLTIGRPFTNTVDEPETILGDAVCTGDFVGGCGATPSDNLATGLLLTNTLSAPDMIGPPAISPSLATPGMLLTFYKVAPSRERLLKL